MSPRHAIASLALLVLLVAHSAHAVDCPSEPGFSCSSLSDCITNLCSGNCTYNVPIFGESTICGIPFVPGGGVPSTCGKQTADGSQSVCPAGSTCSGSSTIKSGGVQQSVIFCNDSQGLSSTIKTLIYVGVALVVLAIALCIFAQCCLAQGIAALCCCLSDSSCCRWFVGICFCCGGRRKQEPLLVAHVSSDSRGNYLPPPMYVQQQQFAPQHMPAALMPQPQQQFQHPQQSFGYPGQQQQMQPPHGFAPPPQTQFGYPPQMHEPQQQQPQQWQQQQQQFTYPAQVSGNKM